MLGAATQGYQRPDSPAVRYRTGLRALADYIKSHFDGKSFGDLEPGDQDNVLKGIELESIALEGSGAQSSLHCCSPIHRKDIFSDPIYGGNRDMAGWRLIGFPGARYDYRDWVERHNEPYPLPPVSIMGRSDWTVKE